MTLEPGDLIATGTPSGVAHARKPPAWMKAGDTVEVEVEEIGVLANPIVDEKPENRDARAHLTIAGEGWDRTSRDRLVPCLCGNLRHAHIRCGHPSPIHIRRAGWDMLDR